MKKRLLALLLALAMGLTLAACSGGEGKETVAGDCGDGDKARIAGGR